uniref:Uncharacterized protein n=1 Tax=Timema genevievae TaxID=629358 RepID=A0A7R9PIM4_TIMGE|nr:unnamed protein product [Timema genevievae]
MKGAQTKCGYGRVRTSTIHLIILPYQSISVINIIKEKEGIKLKKRTHKIKGLIQKYETLDILAIPFNIISGIDDIYQK